MLYRYKYINHEIEKFQKYSDFLFIHVWSKARGAFSTSKFDQYPELKNILDKLILDNGEWAVFFVETIKNIYNEFLKLGKSQRKELKKWYYINNNVLNLCLQNELTPIKYTDLDKIYPTLSKLLKSFYERLYGSTSPFILKIFGNIKDIKNSHYYEFIKANFGGNEGICPFCGLNSIKGNDHSKLEAYDHFIPKGKYPFNSINFRNLAPMCHECNSSYKLENNPLMNIDPLSKTLSRRKAFYPYSLQNWNISVAIELKNADLNTLEKEQIEIKTFCDGMDEEIESWREVFGIEERYRAKLLAQHAGKRWYIDLKDGIHAARRLLNNDKLTKEQWLKFLLNQCTDDPLADCSFLKKPFYEECNRLNIS